MAKQSGRDFLVENHRQIFLAIVFLSLALFAVLTQAQQRRMETFKLNTPIVEEVVFCQEQQAVEHIVTVSAKQGKRQADQLATLYASAGVCGSVMGSIVYTERVGRIGEMNVYRAILHKWVFYVATTMNHEDI